MENNYRVAEFLARNMQATLPLSWVNYRLLTIGGRDWAKTHQPIPLLEDTLFAKGPNPHGNIVIVSCFDVRVQPTAFFGLKHGDANILNNAGGRVDGDAIRSLVVLDSIAGVGTVIVVHHTDCGLTYVSDEETRKMLKEKAPHCAQEIEGMKFGEIKDLTQSVKDDMETIRSSPFLKKDMKILGFVYNITRGTVEEVEAK